MLVSLYFWMGFLLTVVCLIVDFSFCYFRFDFDSLVSISSWYLPSTFFFKVIQEWLLHTIIYPSILTQVDEFTLKSLTKTSQLSTWSISNFSAVKYHLLRRVVWIYLNWYVEGRACSHATDFKNMNELLTQKMFHQSYKIKNDTPYNLWIPSWFGWSFWSLRCVRVYTY